MSGRHEVLLGLLSDGALHSGADLAARLGVSRAAVWKLVGELREREVPVDSHPRRGYRLPRPVELLEPAAIERAATAHGRSLRRGLEVLFETASTNAYLHDAPPPPPGQPRVVFAELQRAGRGRLERDADALRDLAVVLDHLPQVAAEAVLVHLLAGLRIPQAAAVGRELVAQHHRARRIVERLRARLDDENRYLKLRRIAIENLAALL